MQVGHNTFDRDKDKAMVPSALSLGPMHYVVRMSESLHLVFYNVRVNDSLARSLGMEEGVSPPGFVLMGHGYLHHVGRDRR